MPSYDDEYRLTECKVYFDLEVGNENVPDLRSVKYRGNIEHLNCPVCQQPYLRPVTTVCGHTFCKDCIHEHFRSGSSSGKEGFCPLDRTPINVEDPHDLFPTPLIVANMVDDLEVFCLNTERGCKWQGHRWELEKHVTADCGYTGVCCDGERDLELEDSAQEMEENETPQRCTLMVERRFIEEGSSCCVHRFFECKFCQMEVTKITEENHLRNECDFNYITCNLCDNDMIPEKNMATHESNCLKSGRLTCPAKEIGCTWVGNTEPSLEIHIGNGNCQLYQILPHMKTLGDRISTLSEENNYLRSQIHHILGSIIQGKITNLGYHEPMEEIGSFRRDMKGEDQVIYLTSEVERLRNELDAKVHPFINRQSNSNSERQNIINGLVNDNFLMKDDLNLQRALINGLRKQVQFLLFRNRSHSMFNAMPVEFDEAEFSTRSSSEERLNLKL